MKKLLFVTLPFTEQEGRDQSRSRFLWDILHKKYDADLLLIKPKEYLTKPVQQTSGYDQLHSLAASVSHLIQPGGIFHFTRDNRDKFSQILANKRFELILFRSQRCLELLPEVEKTLPHCHIAFDLEQLLSMHPISPKPKNIWQDLSSRLEQARLLLLEKSLLRRSCSYFFPSLSLKRQALQLAGLSADEAHFRIIPDPIRLLPGSSKAGLSGTPEKITGLEKFVLFYGDLSAPSCLDAFQSMAKEIFPLLSKTLQALDIRIWVAGPNPQKIHEQLSGGRIRLIGLVAEPAVLFKSCQLVILPLQLPDPAAGAVICEAARHRKAVLATPIAAADYDFNHQEIALAEGPDAFAGRLAELLSNTGETLELGQKLHDAIRAWHDKNLIKHDLTAYLDMQAKLAAGLAGDKLSIALVTDCFGPQFGKAGLHIQRLAQKLAKTHEIRVFCPRLPGQTKNESLDGVVVQRLYDLRGGCKARTSRSAGAFCPLLLPLLLRPGFDLIQSHCGLSVNSRQAFLAAKLRELPYLLALPDSFPETLPAGGIRCNAIPAGDKPLLNWCERFLIRHADQIFTLTEREYTLIRGFNPNVEEIPLPLDLSEFEAEAEPVRSAYGIPPDAFVFLCLGKITFAHGQDLALQAYARALPTLPGSRFVIVGDQAADPAFYEDLVTLTSREGLQEEVIFTGEVERSEVLSWLRASDITVIPARALRVCDTVIESWASGTTVLQSDAVDPNLVIEGCNGFLFRFLDTDDLAQQMQKAFSQRDNLAELAACGRALVREKYTYAYLQKRYQHAYKQLTL